MMDFTVLLADLRDVAEKYKGKSTEPQVSTLAYVEMFTKILRRAQKATTKYMDQITVLWVALNQLASIYKDLSPGQARDQLCKFIFGLCTRTVLNVQWTQLDEDDKIKRNFSVTVENVNEVLSQQGFNRFKLILELMDSNWTHPILSKIMSGDDEDTEDCLEYIQKEDPEVLKLRIEIMIKENCEEFALNLCSWSLKHKELIDDLMIKEYQIYIYYKQGEYGKMQEVCKTIVCHDGIKVMAHLAKVPTNQELCIRLAQVFLIQDWIKPTKTCCTQELLKLWIHHQYLADKDEERFLDSIWTVAKVCRDTEQIGVLIDGVRNECGDMFIQMYTDLCKYAVNIDKGNIEREQNFGNEIEVKKRKLAMSKTCVRMAFMLKEYDFRISRVCGLTAFALNPTMENLNLVNRLYWTIKNTSAVSVNSKINIATLYEIERLLNQIRPEFLNSDYSWKQLMPVCKKFKQEYENRTVNEISAAMVTPQTSVVTCSESIVNTNEKQKKPTGVSRQNITTCYQPNKANQVPKNIHQEHLAKLLGKKNMTREQIDHVLSQQFPGNILGKANSQSVPIKELDKTIDDLKRSIYLETGIRQTLEKNLSPLEKRIRLSALAKSMRNQSQPKAVHQAGPLVLNRQHSASTVNNTTEFGLDLLCQQLSANSAHGKLPSAHSQHKLPSSPHATFEGSPPPPCPSVNQFVPPTGITTTNSHANGGKPSVSSSTVIGNPKSNSNHTSLKTICPSQSGSHSTVSKPISEQLFNKVKSDMKVSEVVVSKPQYNILCPAVQQCNILRSAGSPVQECAKIAQQIAEMHEYQRAVKEKLESSHLQGQNEGTKAVLNARNIPSRSQISDLLTLTFQGNKSDGNIKRSCTSTSLSSKDLGQYSDALMKTAMNIPATATVTSMQLSQTASFPQQSYKQLQENTLLSNSVGISLDTSNMACEQRRPQTELIKPKYIVTTGTNIVPKLKMDGNGHVSIAISPIQVQPLMSVVVPRSLSNHDKIEELKKTISEMISKVAKAQTCSNSVTTLASQIPISLQATHQTQQSLGNFDPSRLISVNSSSLPLQNQLLSSFNQLELFGTARALAPATINTTQSVLYNNVNTDMPSNMIVPMQSIPNVSAADNVAAMNPGLSQNLNTLTTACVSMFDQSNSSQLQDALQNQQSMHQLIRSPIVDVSQSFAGIPHIVQTHPPQLIFATPLFSAPQSCFSQPLVTHQLPNLNFLMQQPIVQQIIAVNNSFYLDNSQTCINMQHLENPGLSGNMNLVAPNPIQISIQDTACDIQSMASSTLSSTYMNSKPLSASVMTSLPLPASVVTSSSLSASVMTSLPLPASVMTSSSLSTSITQGEKHFIASPAVVKKFLSSLKCTSSQTSATAATTSLPIKQNVFGTPAAVLEVLTENDTNRKSKYIGISGAQESVNQMMHSNFDAITKQNVDEASRKIMELQKKYGQIPLTVTSLEPLPVHVPSQIQVANNNKRLLSSFKNEDTKQKPVSVSQNISNDFFHSSSAEELISQQSVGTFNQSIPDLPDLGAQEFHIDQILNLDIDGTLPQQHEVLNTSVLSSSQRMNPTTAISNVRNCKPQLGQVLHVNSVPDVLSHFEDSNSSKGIVKVLQNSKLLPSKTSCDSVHAMEQKNITQSTYMNAHRIAKEREVNAHKLAHREETNRTIQQQSKSMKCEKCSTNFSTDDQLSAHLSCGTCIVPNPKQAPLTTYVKLNLPLACSYCGLNFNSPKLLNNHIQNYCLKNREAVRKCPKCCCYFHSIEQVRNHLKMANCIKHIEIKSSSGQQEKIQCGTCELFFKSVNEIKEHVQSCFVKSSDISRAINDAVTNDLFSHVYKCTNCSFTNSDEQTTAKHFESCADVKIRNAEFVTMYKCNTCSCIFSDVEVTSSDLVKQCLKCKITKSQKQVQEVFPKVLLANELQLGTNDAGNCISNLLTPSLQLDDQTKVTNSIALAIPRMGEVHMVQLHHVTKPEVEKKENLSKTADVIEHNNKTKIEEKDIATNKMVNIEDNKSTSLGNNSLTKPSIEPNKNVVNKDGLASVSNKLFTNDNLVIQTHKDSEVVMKEIIQIPSKVLSKSDQVQNELKKKCEVHCKNKEEEELEAYRSIQRAKRLSEKLYWEEFSAMEKRKKELKVLEKEKREKLENKSNKHLLCLTEDDNDFKNEQQLNRKEIDKNVTDGEFDLYIDNPGGVSEKRKAAKRQSKSTKNILNVKDFTNSPKLEQADKNDMTIKDKENSTIERNRNEKTEFSPVTECGSSLQRPTEHNDNMVTSSKRCNKEKKNDGKFKDVWNLKILKNCRQQMETTDKKEMTPTVNEPSMDVKKIEDSRTNSIAVIENAGININNQSVMLSCEKIEEIDKRDIFKELEEQSFNDKNSDGLSEVIPIKLISAKLLKQNSTAKKNVARKRNRLSTTTQKLNNSDFISWESDRKATDKIMVESNTKPLSSQHIRKWKGLRAKRLIKKQKFLIDEMEPISPARKESEKSKNTFKRTKVIKENHENICYRYCGNVRKKVGNSFHYIRSHKLRSKVGNLKYSCKNCNYSNPSSKMNAIKSRFHNNQTKKQITKHKSDDASLKEMYSPSKRSWFTNRVKGRCVKSQMPGPDSSLKLKQERRKKHLRAEALRKVCAEKLKLMAQAKSCLENEGISFDVLENDDKTDAGSMTVDNVEEKRKHVSNVLCSQELVNAKITPIDDENESVKVSKNILNASPNRQFGRMMRKAVIQRNERTEAMRNISINLECSLDSPAIVYTRSGKKIRSETVPNYTIKSSTENSDDNHEKVNQTFVNVHCKRSTYRKKESIKVGHHKSDVAEIVADEASGKITRTNCKKSMFSNADGHEDLVSDASSTLEMFPKKNRSANKKECSKIKHKSLTETGGSTDKIVANELSLFKSKCHDTDSANKSVELLLSEQKGETKTVLIGLEDSKFSGLHSVPNAKATQDLNLVSIPNAETNDEPVKRIVQIKIVPDMSLKKMPNATMDVDEFADADLTEKLNSKDMVNSNEEQSRTAVIDGGNILKNETVLQKSQETDKNDVSIENLFNSPSVHSDEDMNSEFCNKDESYKNASNTMNDLQHMEQKSTGKRISENCFSDLEDVLPANVNFDLALNKFASKSDIVEKQEQILDIQETKEKEENIQKDFLGAFAEFTVQTTKTSANKTKTKMPNISQKLPLKRINERMIKKQLIKTLSTKKNPAPTTKNKHSFSMRKCSVKLVHLSNYEITNLTNKYCRKGKKIDEQDVILIEDSDEEIICVESNKVSKEDLHRNTRCSKRKKNTEIKHFKSTNKILVQEKPVPNVLNEQILSEVDSDGSSLNENCQEAINSDGSCREILVDNTTCLSDSLMSIGTHDTNLKDNPNVVVDSNNVSILVDGDADVHSECLVTEPVSFVAETVLVDMNQDKNIANKGLDMIEDLQQNSLQNDLQELKSSDQTECMFEKTPSLPNGEQFVNDCVCTKLSSEFDLTNTVMDEVTHITNNETKYDEGIAVVYQGNKKLETEAEGHINACISCEVNCSSHASLTPELYSKLQLHIQDKKSSTLGNLDILSASAQAKTQLNITDVFDMMEETVKVKSQDRTTKDETSLETCYLKNSEISKCKNQSMVYISNDDDILKNAVNEDNQADTGNVTLSCVDMCSNTNSNIDKVLAKDQIHNFQTKITADYEKMNEFTILNVGETGKCLLDTVSPAREFRKDLVSAESSSSQNEQFGTVIHIETVEPVEPCVSFLTSEHSCDISKNTMIVNSDNFNKEMVIPNNSNEETSSRTESVVTSQSVLSCNEGNLEEFQQKQNSDLFQITLAENIVLHESSGISNATCSTDSLHIDQIEFTINDSFKMPLTACEIKANVEGLELDLKVSDRYIGISSTVCSQDKQGTNYECCVDCKGKLKCLPQNIKPIIDESLLINSDNQLGYVDHLESNSVKRPTENESVVSNECDTKIDTFTTAMELKANKGLCKDLSPKSLEKGRCQKIEPKSLSQCISVAEIIGFESNTMSVTEFKERSTGDQVKEEMPETFGKTEDTSHTLRAGLNNIKVSGLDVYSGRDNRYSVQDVLCAPGNQLTAVQDVLCAPGNQLTAVQDVLCAPGNQLTAVQDTQYESWNRLTAISGCIDTTNVSSLKPLHSPESKLTAFVTLAPSLFRSLCVPVAEETKLSLISDLVSEKPAHDKPDFHNDNSSIDKEDECFGTICEKSLLNGIIEESITNDNNMKNLVEIKSQNAVPENIVANVTSADVSYSLNGISIESSYSKTEDVLRTYRKDHSVSANSSGILSISMPEKDLTVLLSNINVEANDQFTPDTNKQALTADPEKSVLCTAETQENVQQTQNAYAKEAQNECPKIEVEKNVSEFVSMQGESEKETEIRESVHDSDTVTFTMTDTMQYSQLDKFPPPLEDGIVNSTSTNPLQSSCAKQSYLNSAEETYLREEKCTDDLALSKNPDFTMLVADVTNSQPQYSKVTKQSNSGFCVDEVAEMKHATPKLHEQTSDCQVLSGNKTSCSKVKQSSRLREKSKTECTNVLLHEIMTDSQTFVEKSIPPAISDETCLKRKHLSADKSGRICKKQKHLLVQEQIVEGTRLADKASDKRKLMESERRDQSSSSTSKMTSGGASRNIQSKCLRSFNKCEDSKEDKHLNVNKTMHNEDVRKPDEIVKDKITTPQLEQNFKADKVHLEENTKADKANRKDKVNISTVAKEQPVVTTPSGEQLENESDEDFRRRTELLSSLRKKSSGQSYVSDFNFEENESTVQARDAAFHHADLDIKLSDNFDSASLYSNSSLCSNSYKNNGRAILKAKNVRNFQIEAAGHKSQSVALGNVVLQASSVHQRNSPSAVAVELMKTKRNDDRSKAHLLSTDLLTSQRLKNFTEQSSSAMNSPTGALPSPMIFPMGALPSPLFSPIGALPSPPKILGKNTLNFKNIVQSKITMTGEVKQKIIVKDDFKDITKTSDSGNRNFSVSNVEKAANFITEPQNTANSLSKLKCVRLLDNNCKPLTWDNSPVRETRSKVKANMDNEKEKAETSLHEMETEFSTSSRLRSRSRSGSNDTRETNQKIGSVQTSSNQLVTIMKSLKCPNVVDKIEHDSHQSVNVDTPETHCFKRGLRSEKCAIIEVRYVDPNHTEMTSRSKCGQVKLQKLQKNKGKEQLKDSRILKQNAQEKYRNIVTDSGKKHNYKSLDRDYDKNQVCKQVYKPEMFAKNKHARNKSDIDEPPQKICKLDGTSKSPDKFDSEPCSHNFVKIDCDRCIMKKGNRTVKKPLQSTVRNVIHGGRVFEIGEGRVTERDLNEVDHNHTNSLMSDSCIDESIHTRLRPKVGKKSREQPNQSAGEVLEASCGRIIPGSKDINKYISATLNKIKQQKDNNSNCSSTRWTVQKGKAKSKTFPYAFKYRRQ